MSLIVTIDLLEDNVLQAMGDFLESVLPPGVPAVQGLDNRVAEPTEENFVLMIPVMRDRLSTNVDTTTDNFPNAPGQLTAEQSVELVIQLDFHGPQGADYAHIASTLFRDSWGVDQFAASGYNVTPLYTDEPMQVPFLNGEQQIERRWMVQAHVQCNPIVTVTQDFADELVVGLIDIDAQYPPT